MWIYTLTIALSSMLVLIPGAPLVLLMVLSAVVNGLLLPFVLVYAILLINNKQLMGEYTNSKTYNYISWGTVFAVICLTIAWIVKSIL
jgi:Mn2+/Fe2+ NRAMP family transporter